MAFSVCRRTKCSPSTVSAPYSDISTGLWYLAFQAIASSTTRFVIMLIFPGLLYHPLYRLKLRMSINLPCAEQNGIFFQMTKCSPFVGHFRRSGGTDAERALTALSSLTGTAMAAVIGRFGSSDLVKFATALRNRKKKSNRNVFG